MDLCGLRGRVTVICKSGFVAGMLLVAGSLVCGSVHAQLAASVLPSSRSATVGTPVTVFATVINAQILPQSDTGAGAPLRRKELAAETSSEVAVAGHVTDCRIEVPGDLPLEFGFQQTDPATNTPVGQPNEPVDIAANAAASFVLTLAPYAEIAPTHVEFHFVCADDAPARTLRGVNTLALSATLDPVPDLIALSTSVNGAGIVMLDESDAAAPECSRTAGERGLCQVGAFALAAVNIGEAGPALYLNATTPTGARLEVCATDVASGECVGEPDTDGVDVALATGDVGTYSVFVASKDRLAFDPASSRVNVAFVDAEGALRGATSIALASRRQDWFAWRDFADGVSTLRLTGDVLAGTPCHRARVSVATEQDPADDYLALDVQLASTLKPGQSCVQALANVPVTFALPNYLGAYRGVVVRTPLSPPVVVDIRDSF